MGCLKLSYYEQGRALERSSENHLRVVSKNEGGLKKCLSTYRYGFNGKEKDDETSGNGNQYDYGFRIYNPRLGRFLSVDPLFRVYPFYSPYHYASNTPIAAVDEDGLEGDIKFNIIERNDIAAGKTLFPGDVQKQREFIRAEQKGRAEGALFGGAVLLTVLTAGEITPLLARAWLWFQANQVVIGGAGAFALGVLDESGQLQVGGPLDDAGRAATLAFKNFFFKNPTSKVVLEFFGGAKSKIAGALNVDEVATSGIQGTIRDFFNFAKRQGVLGTVDEIVASGPQGEFIAQSSVLLKSGGQLIINSSKGNPFGQLPSSERLKELGFKVVQESGALLDRFKGQTFRRTNGTVIPIEAVKTTILEKL
ncbi:MAG: RHS repeat-associated core domain-containing protein [Flavobacteriales bacterium]|nr:RHS repeat-associated core domain-containing protein [Flavobacteriales bacterium]